MGAAREPLRVVHVTTERGWRGGEQQALNLASALRNDGFEQLVVVRRGTEAAMRFRRGGFAVAAIAARGEWDLLSAQALASIVRRVRPQVVHAHASHAHGLLAIAGLLLGERRPALVVTRRVDFSIYRHGGAAFSRWKYGRAVDRVITVSERIREVLLADGLSPERVCVAHSGIDLSRIDDAPRTEAALRAELGIPAGVPTIGSIGALVPHKDHATLIDAFALLAARRPTARLVIVGDGPLRPALNERIAAASLGARIHLVGWRSDAPSWLRAFDVFAFPSREEGLGTSVLDAMAARRAIVASRAGGIPEMIDDGIEGRLVPPGDPPALAAALGSVLDDPALARAMGDAGRARVERGFTSAGTAAATRAVYRAVSRRT